MALTSYQKGLLAEFYALWFLRIKGYHLDKKRLRTPFGEIDLLMRHKNTFIVVEVKSRKTKQEALYALHYRQQLRLKNAVLWWLSHQKNQNFSLRFDVVFIWPHHLPYHLQNIFQL